MSAGPLMEDKVPAEVIVEEPRLFLIQCSQHRTPYEKIFKPTEKYKMEQELGRHKQKGHPVKVNGKDP